MEENDASFYGSKKLGGSWEWDGFALAKTLNSLDENNITNFLGSKELDSSQKWDDFALAQALNVLDKNGLTSSCGSKKLDDSEEWDGFALAKTLNSLDLDIPILKSEMTISSLGCDELSLNNKKRGRRSSKHVNLHSHPATESSLRENLYADQSMEVNDKPSASRSQELDGSLQWDGFALAESLNSVGDDLDFLF